jgi:hypothetical protein
MSFAPVQPNSRPVPRLLALAIAALALVLGTSSAGQAATVAGKHHREQRLVVRGDSTAVAGPCDAVCPVELTDGRFRATPIGTGPYAGSIKLDVAHAFPNGEGGICAPLKGRIVLGAATSNRLVLAVWGDSCQDGGGPVPSSFTGLARFTVKHATGSYAGATGAGLASFSEDTRTHHHRMTLIGSVVR